MSASFALFFFKISFEYGLDVFQCFIIVCLKPQKGADLIKDSSIRHQLSSPSRPTYDSGTGIMLSIINYLDLVNANKIHYVYRNHFSLFLIYFYFT